MDRSRFTLEQLNKDWYVDLFRFEVENRWWFEKFVDPRPVGYFNYPVFESFQNQLVTEQDQNQGLYFLAIEDQSRVIGRFNLYDINNDVIELGYRIAEDRAGKGITTHLVAEMVKIARLNNFRAIRARVEVANPSSAKVLEKNGFVRVQQQDNLVYFEIRLS